MKAILCKYIPATDRRGSRVKASDMDRNSVTIPFNDSGVRTDEAYHAAARALCDKMNWNGRLVCGSLPGANVYVFDPEVKASEPLTIAD